MIIENQSSKVRFFSCVACSGNEERILNDLNKNSWLVGCRDKANCPHVGPVSMGECPPWGSFKGILTRIYVRFGKNHGKLQTVRSTSATWHLPSSSSRADVLSRWWGLNKNEKLTVIHKE